MKKKKIKVFICCARWLGVNCTERLQEDPNVEIIGVSTTSKHKKVWWDDVIDEVEMYRFGLQDKLVKFEDIPKFIKENKPDITFSILTDYIFKQEDIKRCKYGIINLHPAILPDYRGCNSYAHAIMNGEKEYGVTIHYINPKIDCGEIIKVRKFPILSDDTGKDVYDKAQPIALEMFENIVTLIIKSALKGKKVKNYKQNDKKAKYYNRFSLINLKKIYLFDHVDFDALYDRVRALDFPPHEPCYYVSSPDKSAEEKKVYLTIKCQSK